MALDTFNPQQNPSMSGTDVAENIRLIENKFGDGYISTTPDGINALTNSANLTWSPIHLDKLTNILTFFRSHLGVPFLYKLPDESTARKWYIPTSGWKRSWLAALDYSLTVTFVERFDAN